MIDVEAYHWAVDVLMGFSAGFWFIHWWRLRRHHRWVLQQHGEIVAKAVAALVKCSRECYEARMEAVMLREGRGERAQVLVGTGQTPSDPGKGTGGEG